MNTLEFHRSFITFRIDTLKKQPKTVSHEPPFTLNNSRLPLECRCRITEKETEKTQEFFLGANCKTERVGVERDIWTRPNADFVPVCSRSQWMVLKTFDHVGKGVPLYPPSLGMQPERQVINVDEAFDSLRIDLAKSPGEVLETPEAIVEGVLANRLLNARTCIESDRYIALLDYPVKTINANERDWIYQTDTGPVLLPDLSREPDDLIGGMDLTFVAFNTPNWIELIVRTSTPVVGDVSVYHYSKAIRLDSQNQIIALT
ncbi:MAG: hypothetical protein ABGX16_01800 [Pirellulales bacterium]